MPSQFHFSLSMLFHCLKKMNLDLGLSSYVWNMISLVSRLIYHYHSKPPLSPVDYSPLPPHFRWGNNCLSGLQKCLSWKPSFLICFLNKRCCQNPRYCHWSIVGSWEFVDETESELSSLKQPVTPEGLWEWKKHLPRGPQLQLAMCYLRQCLSALAELVTQRHPGSSLNTLCWGTTQSDWNQNL